MFRKLFTALLAVAAFNVFAAVDVNRATQAELETVKGIGPGLSTKILQAREAGAFKSWADFVDRVGGVGPGNAAKFSQAGLTVGGSALDAAALSTPTKETRKVRAEKGEKADKASQADKTAPRAKKPAAEGKQPQA